MNKRRKEEGRQEGREVWGKGGIEGRRKEGKKGRKETTNFFWKLLSIPLSKLNG